MNAEIERSSLNLFARLGPQAGHSVLQMLEEGYEVQVSADASASWSKLGNDLALRRMENAGVVITTVDQIISELAIDWTSPNGQKLESILEYS
jgi:hypothetical protein